jgi:hypothetical protein
MCFSIIGVIFCVQVLNDVFNTAVKTCTQKLTPIIENPLERSHKKLV